MSESPVEVAHATSVPELRFESDSRWILRSAASQI